MPAPFLAHFRGSLKTRVTLYTLAIFVVGIWSFALYATRMLREDMVRVLGEQQFSTASLLAAGFNQELQSRIAALESMADMITPQMMRDTARLQEKLVAHPFLYSLFNRGVTVIDAGGTAIADAPHRPDRIGANYIERDYVIGALKRGQPTIGQPVVGKILKTPIFAMAVPIRDAGGKPIGVLAGIVDLGKPNFLDNVTGATYGKTGGYVVVAAAQRFIVAASDKKLVTTSLPSPSVMPETDRFADGHEGYAVSVNARGEEMLSAAKHVPLARWNIAVAIPTSEAFAPLREMQQRMLLAAVLLTVLAGGLTSWLLKRELAPMLAAVRALTTRAEGDKPAQALPIAQHDEIGELIAAFNGLLATLGSREKALKESENRLSTILESVESMIYLKDTEGRYVFVNRPMREFFGMENDQIIGRIAEAFYDPQSAAKIRADDREVLTHGKTLRTENTIKVKSGRSATYLTVKLPLRDEAGTIYALCGISTNITERKALEEQALYLAFYDLLTNLPNRRLLEDRVAHAFAASKRTGCHGAVIFIDLDDFKPINDLHGHSAGDQLLTQAAARLKGCVRETDTVARFGGDEFVVLIGELDRERTAAAAQAGAIAQKLRAAIAKPFVLEIHPEGRAKADIEHRCTASIGVSLFLGGEATPEDVLKWADAAMYQAKEAGRNAVRFHEPKPRLAALVSAPLG